ncbi:hypothetical protein GYMLUDRAFT_75256 [Collybiopsis luxurians FD-317 M1]|uniref:Uncharacterized protein n=1 Tax=Collybiopsis luxurians FD-317 M1 TaxID=944289 RepID=A0A0D0C592_9AGAR|nr:hypothetical protein GYMLUDRAFT_75256 [Collybiopsis luxurians FD-317 M1]
MTEISTSEKLQAKRDERTRKLWEDPFYADFPHLYREINIPNSCMAYGCTIGDGWKPLIYDLCTQLVQLDAGVVFDQIKEKFGGLRVYYSFDKTSTGQKPTDSQVEQVKTLVEETIGKADATCETCGAAGTLRETKRGWLFNSCDSCAEKKGV